jgi:hypothetical protein
MAGTLLPVMAAFLLLGAAIQPRARTTGRWLMWVGAFLLTVVVGAYALIAVCERAGIPRQIQDGMIFAIFALGALSTILLLWCDIALLLEALKTRGQRWERGRLDWIVWITAAILTAFCIWSVEGTMYAYKHYGQLDDLLFAAALDASILLFDVALILHAVKTRISPSGDFSDTKVPH